MYMLSWKILSVLHHSLTNLRAIPSRLSPRTLSVSTSTVRRPVLCLCESDAFRQRDTVRFVYVILSESKGVFGIGGVVGGVVVELLTVAEVVEWMVEWGCEGWVDEEGMGMGIEVYEGDGEARGVGDVDVDGDGDDEAGEGSEMRSYRSPYLSTRSSRRARG